MQEISDVIEEVINKLFKQQYHVDLTRPEEQFGDFSTNIALKLAKELNRSPHDVAAEITEKLKNEDFEKVEIAGPGFINITLTDKQLIKLANRHPISNRSDTVVIETNNPNPFKAMHIGHGFNAILGDTVANLIEADGASVFRVSYHGDVGLHVGKSMYSILKFIESDPDKLNTIPRSEHNNFMSKMYSEGSKVYKEDREAKSVINDLAKQSFTREDPVYASVYEVCLKWSFDGIDKIVMLIGNKPIVKRFLESEADLTGVPIVKKNTPAVFKKSDGAYIFEGSKYGSFDNIFVGSNGLGLYGARDIGLMQLKKEQYHPQKSYVITGAEQGAYFKGVLSAAGLIWEDQQNVTVNIPTGLVKLSTGKMSSRDGDVIEIEWLFNQFKQAIIERGGEPLDELVAGALRYQFLKVKIGNDVVFDINEAVGLKGNTGSYLQYAHARAKSILSKQPEDVQINTGPISLLAGERQLVRKLGEYSEVFAKATAELMPHYICNYLYELAQEFNRFYENNRVIGDERESIRVNLVQIYANTLQKGLSILGIFAPEKM